jgi:predicted AAA+ superfamily ATPase
METGEYISRKLLPQLRETLERGKSVLLLGARQTGKTTLTRRLNADLSLNLLAPEVRRRFERDPGLLAGEVDALTGKVKGRLPLVVLDEVQRVPELMNAVQDLVDRRVAKFLLTGSSARKLRRGRDTNWLPGRLIPFRLDPLTLSEHQPASLTRALMDGALPGLVRQTDVRGQEQELQAYAGLYLEEEIRAEALVRNIGAFSRFLQLAAGESGGIFSFRALAQELGLTHPTVAGYFEILEDCLLAERIEPFTATRGRKRLTKSPRYLFFDLGVRRCAAEEGRDLPERLLGGLFEQFVGLELLRESRLAEQPRQLRFWRDADGPEVDWVVCRGETLLPVECKWTDSPSKSDARHLETFLREHPGNEVGLIVCRTPRRIRVTPRVTALPWQELPVLLEEFC